MGTPLPGGGLTLPKPGFEFKGTTAAGRGIITTGGEAGLIFWPFASVVTLGLAGTGSPEGAGEPPSFAEATGTTGLSKARGGAGRA